MFLIEKILWQKYGMKKKMVAEVNKEIEKFVIEFYLDEKISFMLDEFFEVLENAKRRILER